MRLAAFFLASGCICVADPTGRTFPCGTKSDCLEGFDCVGGECAAPDSGTGGGGAASAGGGAGGGHAVETNCANLVDDDQDGLTDCEDPDCAQKRCAGLGVPVCCGTSCIDTSQSVLNCGGCGLACASGTLCTAIATGAAVTGTCGCFATTCPGSQSCFGDSYCTCSSASDCAALEVCDTGAGHGACRYP